MSKTLGAATTALVLSTACLALVYTPLGACPPQAISYSQSYQVAPAVVSYQVATVKKGFAKQQADYSYQAAPAAAYVQPEYYSSVSDYYQQKVLLDAVTGRFTDALKLQEELQTLRSQLRQLQTAPPQYPQYPQYQPQPSYAPPQQQQQYQPQYQPPQQQYQPQPQPQRLPAQAPQQAPPPPEPQPQQHPKEEANYNHSHTHNHSVTGTVPERLHEVVRTSCTRCHGDTNDRQGGGIDLRNLETVDRELRLLAYTSTVTGEMPRGGKKLSDEEKAEFLEWYRLARSTQARR